MEINPSANTCAAPHANHNAKPAEFINLTPSSFSHTKPPSGYYTHIFQGKPVTVITDASCISHAVDGETMFGLTPNALDWLEREQEVPPDPTRRPLYPPFSQLQPHQRVLSLAEAQQDWETRDKAQRAAPFPDPTLAQVLANAPQLVEDWYTAVIDLSQTRDAGHTLGCSYLTRRAGNGQLYTTPESIMMLFWKMVSIITEGVTKGHLKTTNVIQTTRMRRHGLSSGLCAQQIIDDAIQSIRWEKMILVDLLGPGGKECMTNFVWCPKGYAEVKLYDRTCNMVRKFGGKRAMEKKMATTTTNTETLHTVEDPPSALDGSHTPDQDPPNTEASAASPEPTQPATPDRPSSLFPPWSALPPTSHLTTPAAASAHRATTDRLSRSPPRPDANLAAFRAHLPLFAAHLYTAVVSVSHIQDNPSSRAYARFVRPPYSFPPTATTPAVRAIQSTCHRLCLSLARAAAAGYARPLAHDGSLPELHRHRAAFMEEVLGDDEGVGGVGRGGDEGGDADVLQRFGAICEAVRREKTLADAFRTGSCRDLKVADLLREPLAYALTKAAHRRSNRTRPDRGGEGAGSAAKAPARRRRRKGGAEARSGAERVSGAAGGVPQRRGAKKRADGEADGVPQRSGKKRVNVSADASADGVPQRSGKKRAWHEDAQPAFRVKRQRLETAEGRMGVIDFGPKREERQRRGGGRDVKMEDREPCDPGVDAPVLPQAAGSGGGFQGFKHHGLPMALVLAYMGGSRESGQVKTEQQLKVEQDVSTLMGDVLAESLD
ncbi:Replication factor-a protein 1 subfamily protein [Neofusicoccum parvum]|nr:Replication factor-a protein 1 subfamily protein [Neofusicoccum parvum]